MDPSSRRYGTFSAFPTGVIESNVAFTPFSAAGVTRYHEANFLGGFNVLLRLDPALAARIPDWMRQMTPAPREHNGFVWIQTPAELGRFAGIVFPEVMAPFELYGGVRTALSNDKRTPAGCKEWLLAEEQSAVRATAREYLAKHKNDFRLSDYLIPQGRHFTSMAVQIDESVIIAITRKKQPKEQPQGPLTAAQIEKLGWKFTNIRRPGVPVVIP